MASWLGDEPTNATSADWWAGRARNKRARP